MNSDPNLVGHWRHTDSLSSGEMALITDTHYVLNADGKFEHYVKSRSAGFEPTDDDKAYGQWGAQEGRIFLKFENGESFSAVYQLQGETMFLPEEPTLRIWKQIDQ